MPEAGDPSAWIAVEPMFTGLAKSIVDLTRLPPRTPDRPSPITRGDLPKLETVALGALTYSDVYVGDRWHTRRNPGTFADMSSLGPVDAFLQLRTYHVDYVTSVMGSSEPLLTLMSKGSVCDHPVYRDTTILKPYWLG